MCSFICTPQILKHIAGIYTYVVYANFKVQVAAGGHAGAPHQGYGLPYFYYIALCHQQLAAMGVQHLYIFPRQNNYVIAVIPLAATQLYYTTGGGILYRPPGRQYLYPCENPLFG